MMRVTAASVGLALVVLGTTAASAGLRLYVTVDKSNVMTLGPEPVRTVSVTNPGIADVIVLSPTQLVINAKAVGATSLLFFYPKRVEHVDLIVQPPPLGGGTAPSSVSEARDVLIQRADKITGQTFVRERDQDWIELGRTRPDAPNARPEGK